MTKRRAPKPLASYPPQYGKILNHVASTGRELIINNLGSDRKKYTSLRARVNEYRRALYDSALMEGNKDLEAIASSFYSVVLRNPEQDEKGQWFIRVTPKQQEYANALDDILKTTDDFLPDEPTKEPADPEEKDPSEPSASEMDDLLKTLYRSEE